MSQGGDAERHGLERVRDELPARVHGCRLRRRPPSASRPSGPLLVDCVVDGARTTLVLAAAEAGTAVEASNARDATIAEGSDLYGVVDPGTVTVRRVEDPADATRDRAVCTAVPVARLRSVLALVAWHVRTTATALYDRFEALRRAVEPLARTRLDRRLDDAGFTDRLRDALRAAGPVDDDPSFGPDERAALAAQASGLFVDAVVAAAGAGSIEAGDPSERGWAAVVARIRDGVDDPLFDPTETPLADLVLGPPPLLPASAFATATDAFEATLRALDRLSLTFDESTLARVFERLVPRDRRWRWGQVYTPAVVARLLAAWTVGGGETDGEDDGPGDDDGNGSDRPGAVASVFDPAWGTGGLLRAAVEHRRDRGQPPPAVYGRDVFDLPAALARRSLPDDVAVDVTAGDFFDCVPSTVADGGGETATGCDADADADAEVGSDVTSGEATRVDPVDPVDAVLMNPPYTRREALDDDYTAFVRRAVAGGETVDRRAGLAPYFVRHATSFLREGGRMGVVVGSSWLDADYGAGLRSFLLDSFRVHAVVDAPRHHLVDTADVNAVLLLLERTTDAAERDDTVVSFVRLRAAPADLAAGDDDVLAALADEGGGGRDGRGDPPTDDGSGPRGEEGSPVRSDPSVEVVHRRQGALRRATAADGRRSGRTAGQWGRYVRAPSAYWDVIDTRGERLVDFHDLAAADWARLSYGTRSGAPDFFYLPNAHHDVVVDGETLRVVPRDAGLDEPCRLPRRYWMHRPGTVGVDETAGTSETAGVGDEWRPNYLLKRTTGVDRIRFGVSDLELGTQLRYVMRFSEDRDRLDPAARTYVEWGESHDVAACPHCRRAEPFPAYCAGERWYDITGRLTRGTVLPNKDVHATHAYWTPSTPLWVHQSLYGIDATDPPLLAGLLNSTLGLLMLEVAGRVSLGEGALDLMTGDHRSVVVPDPRSIDTRTRDRIVGRFGSMASRSVGTVFEECGARQRDAVSVARVRPDRRALDELVMGEVLDLPASTQRAVYRGLVGLVDDRLTKAGRGR